jgi:peptidyl-prolyl cis-trans isomerase C
MTSRFSRALVAVAALAVTACDRDVVISAGKTAVDTEGWRQFQSRRSASADVDRGLEDLSSRLLLAEAGRRDGLDGQPEVKARLASARREILAQAYLDKELASADREDVLRQRYQAGQGGLVRRRIRPAHIAFRIKEGEAASHAAAESKAARAYARLAGGEPFEKLAQAMSDDPLTGAKGGDLGPLLEGEVDAGFFAAAASLKKGEVSRPVETPFGFHLIKALEELSTVTPSFEEARGRLAAEARREAQTKLLERLKGDIGVRLHRERALAAAPGAGKRGDGR